MRLPVRLVVLVPVRPAWDALVAGGRLLRDRVLRPVGRGLDLPADALGAGVLWLGRALFVPPWAALRRRVLAPAGRALRWTWHHLVAAPAVFAWRWLITAPARFAWRWAVVVPLAFAWRWGVVAPGRWLRVSVLRPGGTALARAARAVGAVLRRASGVRACLGPRARAGLTRGRPGRPRGGRRGSGPRRARPSPAGRPPPSAARPGPRRRAPA